MNSRHLLFALGVAGLAGAVLAQYKVVGPDGRVTYTDRPPVNEPGKVTPLGRGGSAASAAAATDSSLPFDLRQVAVRYPVTLYSAANCTPCDSGRQLLQQRGVPYSEKRIVTEEDSIALDRLTGGRTVPSVTVGAQPLRGFNPDDWGNYLDAAGYPRESRLPRNWQAPPVTPLVSREAAPAAAGPTPAAAPAPAPTPATAPVQAPAPGPAFRF